MTEADTMTVGEEEEARQHRTLTLMLEFEHILRALGEMQGI